MNIKAINFIGTHCAGPLREARMQSLTDLLEEVKAEQRQVCADESEKRLISWIDEAATRGMIQEVKDACLNATGEKE